MISNRTKAPKFNYQEFQKTNDKYEYVEELLSEHLLRKKLDTNAPYLCMNELLDIISDLEIADLKIKQMHQVFLYSTYQKFESKNQAKKKLEAMMNQEKKKVDVRAVTKWLVDNLEKNAIKPIQRSHQSHRPIATSFTNKTKGTSSNHREPPKNKVDWKLPPIKGTSSQKLTEQLKFLVEIFQEMEKERQNSGLIPINMESDDQQLDLSATHIPYDPQLYILNNNLAKLRYKAQERLSRIIELARDEPRIRRKLEQAIQKFQKTRIEANQKVGRIGAMKAQKRLIERKEKEHEKFKKLKLGEEEDLLKAAHLYSLVIGVQEKKMNHNLIF